MGSLATAPISCITPLYVRADSIAEFSEWENDFLTHNKRAEK